MVVPDGIYTFGGAGGFMLISDLAAPSSSTQRLLISLVPAGITNEVPKCPRKLLAEFYLVCGYHFPCVQVGQNSKIAKLDRVFALNAEGLGIISVRGVDRKSLESIYLVRRASIFSNKEDQLWNFSLLLDGC